jgi:hypothetical protein
MRIAFVAVAALIAACSRPAESAAPAQDRALTIESVRLPPDNSVNPISGLVKKREIGSVMVDSGGPTPIPLRVDASTKVTIDDQPATSADLREGHLVRAAYRLDASGTPVAIQVVANSHPPR